MKKLPRFKGEEKVPFMLLVALGTLVLDQLSKLLVRRLMWEGESIVVVPRVFHLTYIRNPGAAFGLLAHQTAFFIGIALVVVGAVLFGHRYIPDESRAMRFALGLLAGGALGNLLDRLRFGRVVDFLDFRVWPVFNLADTAIVIGACLLVLEVWRRDRRGGGPEQEMNPDARH